MPRLSACPGKPGQHCKRVWLRYCRRRPGRALCVARLVQFVQQRACPVRDVVHHCPNPDEVAVDIAANNLELNRIDPRKFRLTTGNLGKQLTDSFDIVAANIFTPVILELLKDIPRLLTPGGVFVCSGIITENRKLFLQ